MHQNARSAGQRTPTSVSPSSHRSVRPVTRERAVLLAAVPVGFAEVDDDVEPCVQPKRSIKENQMTNNELKNRLSRIEGQLRGLQKMLDEDRDCKEIVQQFIAVRSGMQSASLAYLDQLTDECLLEQSPDNQNAQKIKIKELIGMVSKLS